MDIFEYLPQLIVAYDGNDKFANLIHVKKSVNDKEYFCPCCGGTVKPRALKSTKEQSHYYHVTGKCTKESQLHFFCKNWLFEEGSKFYIRNDLFEVSSIDIEKTYYTSFGDYRPDITVHTKCGKDIYFEMFFTNRKTGDDYFCKWSELGNDVVEVNIKEYMFKTDMNITPVFSYLYHDGICYSKAYIKKDLYANTIAKIKGDLTRQQVLNYKARIEQLDWFWQAIRDNSKENILDIISHMEYDDMVSCYEIVKRKHCVSYLKNDILDIINQKVISGVRDTLKLPYDENVYFDLRCVRGRTYEAGIRLNIKTKHIIYDDLYMNLANWQIDKLKEYPKIVFSGKIFKPSEIIIPNNKMDKLKKIYSMAMKYKEEIIEYDNMLSDFEGNDYKIKVNNNRYTVLAKVHGENFELVLDNHYINSFDLEDLLEAIQYGIYKIQCEDFIKDPNTIERIKSATNSISKDNSEKCVLDIVWLTDYDFENIHFIGYVNKTCVYDKKLEPNPHDLDVKINDCVQHINYYCEKYTIIYDLADEINNCKNRFWKSSTSLSRHGILEMSIDQNIFTVKKPYLHTLEKITFSDIDTIDYDRIKNRITTAMYRVLKNMERCGYRVMEVAE